MYSLKFTNEGFTVKTSLSSQDTLAAIEEESFVPDIMLVDLVMPTVDGFELIKKTRTHKAYDKTCVVVLSNLGENDDIERAKKLGADGYVIKANVTPTEVVEKVREIAKKKKG